MKETLEQQTGYDNEPLQQIVGSETGLAARSRDKQSSVEQYILEGRKLILDFLLKIDNMDPTHPFYQKYPAHIENDTEVNYFVRVITVEEKNLLCPMSQDTDHSKIVQRKLCNDKAVKALVEDLKYWNGVHSYKSDSHLFYVLDALANLLDSESNRGNHLPQQQVQQELDSVDDAYSDFINSDGLSVILEIVVTSTKYSCMSPPKAAACRLLLLLSQMVKKNASDCRMVTAWQEVRKGLDIVVDHATSKNIMSMTNTCARIKSLIDEVADLQAQQETSIAEFFKLTVLSGDPLFDSSTKRPMDKLAHDREKTLFLEVQEKAPSNFELRIVNATRDRLQTAIFEGCQCIHFSGHGNEQYLAFEHGEKALGVVDQVSHPELQDIFEGTKTCKLVVLSACSSENAGKVLINAKIPHVVCIKTGCEVNDAAALEFARYFFQSLARGESVKKAFDCGLKGILSLSTWSRKKLVEESEKFLLLPLHSPHDEIIFQAPQEQQSPIHRKVKHFPPSLETRNLLQEDPSDMPPTFVCGREADTCSLSRLVRQSQVICVVGEKDANDGEARGKTGIGRYSLVCALCHHINERRSILLHSIEKIYFVEVRKYWEVHNKFKKLLMRLLKLFEIPEKYAAGNDIIDIVDRIKRRMEEKMVNPKKAMFVFCRIETLSPDDLTNFGQLVGELRRTGARILYTDEIERRFDDVVPTLFTVLPLNFRGTVLLFAQCLNSRDDQHKTLLKNFAKYEVYFPKEVQNTVREKMGGGMPLQIQEKARSCRTFNDLEIPGMTTAWLTEKVGEAEEAEKKRKQEAVKLLEENERKRKLGEDESKS